MGISTHTKRLIGWTKNITAVLAKKYKQAADKAVETKSNIGSMRKKSIAFFRRPLSDISHLSVIIVICLALFTGFSALTTDGKQVSINPFLPKNFASNSYISADEKRILEADLVTTLASIHSDSLGIDAAWVTQGLYKKESNISGDMTSVVSMPQIAPTLSSVQQSPITKYVVQNGDTLSQIATKFNISTDTIRYVNKLDDVDSIKPGSTLTILSSSGILYTTVAGDTIASVASKYNISQDEIIAVNGLYGDELTAGMEIVLPDAEIPEAPKPTPAAPTESDNSDDYNDPGISFVKTSTGPNHFPWGWCTWWVAQKRYVPWSGNAWQWFGNSQAYGRPVGRTPVPGSILVTWESGYGHVAYVESANGNSFTVSEMNYEGFGRISTRSITVGDGTPIIGFIY